MTKSLVDSRGAKVALDGLIAQGGEGAVYRLARRADLVAKVYHKPPSADRVAKLRSMASEHSPELTKLACWPLDLLKDARSEDVQGFLMPNAAGHKEAFKLYSPKARATEFRDVDWRFLIASATNVARAFAVVHRKGHVIGDVNHSSVMIAPDTTVRLIDCDSFQIKAAGRCFPCDVAEPLHTAPELQGRSLKGLERTPNHDQFGLAVLIFELLFMGRHPFAGAYLGTGDVSLEQKIARYLFAYGAGAAGRQVKQPPNTLSLQATSPAISSAFERAFSPEGATKGRPSAAEWVTALSGLQRELKRCARDASHFYHPSVRDCPWCAIEGATGVALFSIAFAPAKTKGGFDLALVWASIQKVGPPPHDDNPAQAPLQPLEPNSEYASLAKRRTAIRAVAACASLALLACVLVFPSFACPALGGAVAAWFLITGAGERSFQDAKERAATEIAAARRHLSQLNEQWIATASRQPFDEVLQQLITAKSELENFPARRQREIEALEGSVRDRQMRRHLDRHRLKPGLVAGVGSGRCATLSSYGIETAADVTQQALLSVPGIGPRLAGELLFWRRSIELQFRFDPSKGVDPADLRKVEASLAAARSRLEARLGAGASRLAQAAAKIENARRALSEPIDQARKRLAQAEANAKRF